MYKRQLQVHSTWCSTKYDDGYSAILIDPSVVVEDETNVSEYKLSFLGGVVSTQPLEMAVNLVLLIETGA